MAAWDRFGPEFFGASRRAGQSRFNYSVISPKAAARDVT
jgi:hypothetical protein